MMIDRGKTVAHKKARRHKAETFVYEISWLCVSVKAPIDVD